jgi:Fe-S cluster assembly protein SufD
MMSDLWKYTDLSVVKDIEWSQISGVDLPDVAPYKKPGLCLYIINGKVAEAWLPKAAGLDIAYDDNNITIEVSTSDNLHMNIIVLATAKAEHCELATHINIQLNNSATAQFHWHYYFEQVTTWHQVAMNITLQPKAWLKQCFYQNETSGSIRFQEITVLQKENSHYESLTLSEGLALDRVDTRVILDGVYANCLLRGFYRPTDTQQCNHYISVCHREKNSTSEQYYKGIIDDKAHAVFNSRVHVEPGADGSQSEQVNKNILLSSHAIIDTKPDLEIYADDVQCAHGATVGELDEQAFFYLRSRGISSVEAKKMLIEAFAADILMLFKECDDAS